MIEALHRSRRAKPAHKYGQLTPDIEALARHICLILRASLRVKPVLDRLSRRKAEFL
jgi:hypothetical protein